MPRNPNTPCSGCGKLCYPSKKTGDPTYVPPAEHWCRDCRRADPDRFAPHGASRYLRHGCRCDICRGANSERIKAYGRGLKEREGVTLKQKYGRPWHRATWIAPNARLALYERDAWTCWLCGDPVDQDGDPNGDLAPSLDHIVPRSATLFPDDSPQNLRTAHRACNARRGDRVIA